MIIHDVKDRDPRAGVKRDGEGLRLAFSDEILTEKSELETYVADKETCENEFISASQPDNVEKIMKVKRLDD